MDNPRIDIDPRYSDDGAKPTSWEHTDAILETAQLFWIATVRDDGRPHLVPLVAVWLDGMIHFSSGPEEQKTFNLRQQRDVALLTGSNQWYEGLDVVVEGPAERVTEPDRLERIATAWDTKWNGFWGSHTVTEEGFRGPSGGTAWVYAVRPTKIFAFGRGAAGFSQTRYRPAARAPRP
jgi:nitroimidazol reductase NimA-like FMN-containing flavoprotein (pyridoxamine 5'-phosphate oxidase superfamily)